jgi:archaeal flagellar protein FlaJ
MAYRLLSAVYPANFKNKVRELLQFTNLKIEAGRFIGISLAFSLGAAVAAAFNLFVVFRIPVWIVLPAVFVAMQLGTYGWLSLAADKKGELIVAVLPEALQMMATNIKSGLTIDRAVIMSARPEFGLLANELKSVSREVVAGTPFETALFNMTKRVRSKVLERTVSLIVEGIRSGGKLAELLEQTAKDLQDQQVLQKEISANVGSYALFIFIAAALGAPLLFGLSSFIIQVLSSQLSITTPLATSLGSVGLSAAAGGVHIDPKFVVYFSIILLSLTSIFASLIIGIISAGSEKAGYRYIPIVLACSMTVFFITRHVITKIFGHLLRI